MKNKFSDYENREKDRLSRLFTTFGGFELANVAVDRENSEFVVRIPFDKKSKDYEDRLMKTLCSVEKPLGKELSYKEEHIAHRRIDEMVDNLLHVNALFEKVKNGTCDKIAKKKFGCNRIDGYGDEFYTNNNNVSFQETCKKMKKCLLN